MKKILIFLIFLYQGLFSQFIKNMLGINRMCKFSTSCSEYTKQMVERYGIYGILLGAKRIGVCR